MLSNYFLYFLIYSFLGWFWEVMLYIVRDHKLVNRGFLNGPYCPIYGCGAVLFVLLAENFCSNPIVLFLLGGLIACVLEYITSYVLEKLFHARWWDYSDYKFHINGRVSLIGYVFFGLGASVVPLVHPHIAKFVSILPDRDALAITTAVIFILDIIITTQSFSHFNHILREFQATLNKGRIVSFIRNGKNKFIAQLEKRSRTILTYPQRRLMRAFPNFRSKYDRAFKELKNIYKQNAHARKKGKKIVK